MTKVGWEFVSWTRPSRPCSVPSCNRHTLFSGWVRVDQPRPWKDGTPVLCVRCYNLIQAGVDPDPGAAVPEWEQANRDERLKEAMANEA